MEATCTYDHHLPGVVLLRHSAQLPAGQRRRSVDQPGGDHHATGAQPSITMESTQTGVSAKEATPRHLHGIAIAQPLPTARSRFRYVAPVILQLPLATPRRWPAAARITPVRARILLPNQAVGGFPYDSLGGP